MGQERQTKRFLTTRLMMLGSVMAASSVLPSMEWKRVLPRGQQSTRRIPEKVTTPSHFEGLGCRAQSNQLAGTNHWNFSWTEKCSCTTKVHETSG